MPPAKKKAAAAPAKKTTALATQGSRAVGKPLDRLARASGAGLKEITSQDVSMPFLAILQSNSPQLKKSSDKYIKGAEEGQIINTATQEIMDADVNVVVCGYQRKYVEWVPREDGGGFVKEHDRTSDYVQQLEKDDRGRYMTENGNHIIDTAIFYVLYDGGEEKGWERAVIAMTSTQLKKARKWCTALNSSTIKVGGKILQAPIFGFMYNLSTAGESNDNGSWMGWVVRKGDMLEDEELIDKAEEFAAMVNKGEVAASHGAAPHVDDEEDEEVL